MAHTDLEIRKAAERYAEQLEHLDPADHPAEAIDELRAVAEAADAVTSSEAQLREAVGRARARGHSWNRIAIALGTSRQAARQRFADKVGA